MPEVAPQGSFPTPKAATPTVLPRPDLPGWPRFDPDEIEAATATLHSGRVNYWTGGNGRAFEDALARRLGRKHAIAVANGTLALELAMIAAGIGPGDEVIVPSRTFIASASAAVARGARVVCADVDRDSGNLTAATVEAAITDATRAVVIVHLGGWPADVEAIARVCAARNIAVIEDCAQAHGARLRGREIGSIAPLAAFSYCQDKIMTTGGEGGMVVCDDEAQWQRMWSYKDHGKDFAEVQRADHPPGFRWLHGSFGSNYRLTEMQAAIGLVQLGKLDTWIDRRKRNAMRWRERLADAAALRTPWPGDEVEHAFYRLYTYVELARLRDGWSRDRIVGTLGAAGIPVTVGSCSEIWRERAFPPAWQPAQPLPVAAELGRSSLALLCHPTLEESDVDAMADATLAVLRAATR